MNQDFELNLQAWLDDEVSPAEARRVSRQVSSNAEAARLVEELGGVKRILAGNELALSVPETREFYWSKIERQIEREAVAASPAPARVAVPSRLLRWLSPLTGFGALACILFLAIRPIAPAAFDEISSTGEGMEAVTFHDQSAGMTVVWLADTTQAQTTATPDAQPQDTGNGTIDPEVEME